MSNKLLTELLEEFRDKIGNIDGGVPRAIHLPMVPNKIKTLIGMRRTGKTYFLYQTIKALLAKKIPVERILFLNFEDDRLFPADQAKLRELIEAFYTLYPENHHDTCYFFLDEIQNVEQWPQVVRRFFDTKQAEIFLTGSSAKLLSKEIATSLRGRSISTECWPYSFQEYLTANEINFSEKKPLGKISRDKFSKHLLNYLEVGGFPEIVNLDITDRIRVLQDYVNVVIFKDIIERYKITNIFLVKYIIKTLIKSAGGTFSTNKFFNDIKSQGFGVSKMTVYDYISYIEDAYLAFTIPLYSPSFRKTQTNPRKIYIVDTGLINAYNAQQSNNIGRLFENLIYLDLRRKGWEVYYYLTQNRYEIDFLAKSIDGKFHLYQVVWDVHDSETLERETRALKEAEKELGIKGQLITPEIYIENILQNKDW